MKLDPETLERARPDLYQEFDNREGYNRSTFYFMATAEVNQQLNSEQLELYVLRFLDGYEK